MNLLEEIIANKRMELVRRRSEGQTAATVPEDASPPPSFTAALRSAPLGLIAEVKRRSPSAGAIREPFDPPAIAGAYQAAGAQAISVLMDETYFAGGEADFRSVREAVTVPLLYKEFVIDPWQIEHARAIGASAVLLLAGVLDRVTLREFRSAIEGRGMEALVEVHDAAQMRMAVDAGARCIGVNNRNLEDFSVSLETSLALIADAPDGCTLISESGIRTPADVEAVREAGYHGVLVGEQLLRQPDPGAAVKDLMGSVWTSSSKSVD